ncbi:hypothetical protein HPB48_009734 [Haemaphysalis longicornis]|uniref:Monocarboxylate transporter n=1 Tax=Haemaphysalis longicornis TaxID=44386 RepID=A0A9J6GNH2_HAELO|nr:hypothetical protein HPB48_009734 [Haemaphysalis longicornis]
MARSEASLKADPFFGVDSTWSWVTVAFLSWVLCLGMMGQHSVGVLFYGIVDTFGATRQQASWPLVLSGSLLNLGGPVIGLLCRRFSCRSVLFVSTFVLAASTGVCWFANNILFLTVVYGIIHGLAVSGTFVSVNILAPQHFEKLQTTACSIVFTASGLSLLCAPALAEFLRATYGVRGTFLLLGGVILNAFPAVIVLRSPAWMQRPAKCPTTKKLELSQKTAVIPNGHHLQTAGGASNGTSKEVGIDLGCTPEVATAKPTVILCPKNLQISKIPSTQSTRLNKTSEPSLRAIVRQFATVAFAVDALTFSVMILVLVTFKLISVDIAVDRGVTPSRAVFLSNAFGASDLVFRFASGMVIDSGLLTLETVMLSGFFLQALALELFAWWGTFPVMLVSSALIGISNGSRIFLRAPTLLRDFGMQSLPVTMGGMAFCIGMLMPVLHIRDISVPTLTIEPLPQTKDDRAGV